MKIRKYGTCFFEQYARISLSSLLGERFDILVNRDRPDLQSVSDRSLGIEVTRAMEESKRAEQELLKDVAGVGSKEVWDREDLERIVENGYGYGLGEGQYIGEKELPYWSMALPLQRILESKVSKVGRGFYGRFDQMGLYVFCKDNLQETTARKALRFTMDLQRDQELRYDRLYLSDVDDLFVCRLEKNVRDSARMVRFPITRAQRKAFYLEAIRMQI